MPFAHGRATVRLAAVAPPASPSHTGPETVGAESGQSLTDGLEFSSHQWPSYVQFVDGVGPAEPGGRWVHEPSVQIALTHTLVGRFRLTLKPLSYPEVSEVPIRVRIGDCTRSVTFGQGDVQTIRFDVAKATNTVDIVDQSAGRGRYTQRFGLARIRLVPDGPFPIDDGAPGTVLATMDFSQPEPPDCLVALTGLSGWEEWGRWSDRGTVTFDLARAISGRFSVSVRAVAHDRNVG